MKRIFDFFLAIVVLFLLIIPIMFLFIAVWLSSKGPALHWSDRIGKNNKIFKMPKFRSMLIDAPAVATHLLDNTNSYLSFFGSFLRLSSLDELPQLFTSSETGRFVARYSLALAKRLGKGSWACQVCCLFSKRYWYDLDYQEREPNGDDGKRVIEQE
jgi:hypothetical protein